MYRPLIHHGTLFRQLIKWTTKSNDLARNIHLSIGRVCKPDTELCDDLISISYSESFLKPLKRSDFENYLKTKLRCSTKVATNIWFANPVLSERCLYDVESNVNLLTEKGVTTLLDHPELLCLRKATLRLRVGILESMKPVRLEDFLPLATVEDERLIGIREIADLDAETIPSRHRIYHFSELLDMKPCVISKYISGRLFMLEMPFTKVDLRIRAALTYKTPQQIVKNLHVMKKGVKVHESICKAKWNANQKSNQLAEYYARRLEYDIEKVQIMMNVYPYLRRIELEVIDKRLDFLLLDVGVDTSEIIFSPRIMLQKLEKLTERYRELQSYGYGQKRHHRLIGKFLMTNKQFNAFLVKLKEQWEQQGRSNSFLEKWKNFRKRFSFS